MQVPEISKEIVGLIYNGILVTKVTDGTMDTVPEVIYRYKFPVEKGYAKDREEKTIIKESPKQLFGYNLNGKQVGTELIDVRCAKPDDKRVWWVPNAKFIKEVYDRDPVTKRAITRDKLVNPQHCVGTYEEFVEAVNRATKEDAETPDMDIPGATPDEEDFNHEDIEFIKANYKTMSDADMAEELATDEVSVREFRVKTLKLKKKPGGAQVK